MAGVSKTTAIFAFKNALVDTTAKLMADSKGNEHVHVCAGTPGTYAAADIMSFGRVTSTQDVAAMGGNRPREETLTVELTISCFRGGGEDQEIISQERAIELLGIIERHVRMTDTTLGGVVRQCFLTSLDSEGATPPEFIAEGRAVDVSATFTARNRVTG